MNPKIESKELEKLSKKIQQATALGLILILLGFLAIIQPVFTTVTPQLIFEEMAFGGGIVRFIYALITRRSKKFWLKLLVSLLYIITGLLVAFVPGWGNPINITALGITVLISGTIEIVLAIQVRRIAFQWGWILLSGVIAIILGVLLTSGINNIWISGILVGINLFATGLWMTMVSRAAYLTLKEKYLTN